MIDHMPHRRGAIGRLSLGVAATPGERQAPMAGDLVVPGAAVIMNRAFTLPGRPDAVFPWLVQLGKRRAGWYLPRPIERVLPRSRRAIRHIDPRWPTLSAGDVIPDYGGRNETFTVASIDAPHSIVYASQRRDTHISWALTLTAADRKDSTRVQVRLRTGPVNHRRVWGSARELLDLLTVAGMAAGLRERLAEAAPPPRDS